MTNDKLKKKIVDALYGNMKYELHYLPDDNYTEVVFDYEKIADALIAAGIGDVSEYNKLAYEVRCNLTSITRYIYNKNRQHNKKYKELAEKAVNNILNLVNPFDKNNCYKQAEKELQVNRLNITNK